MDIICGGSFGDKRQNTQIHELHCWVLQNDSQGEKLPWRHSFTKIILENTPLLKGVNILSFQFVRLIQMLQCGTKSGFSELPLFKSWHRFYSGGGGMGQGKYFICYPYLQLHFLQIRVISCVEPENSSQHHFILEQGSDICYGVGWLNAQDVYRYQRTNLLKFTENL